MRLSGARGHKHSGHNTYAHVDWGFLIDKKNERVPHTLLFNLPFSFEDHGYLCRVVQMGHHLLCDRCTASH